jgi:hypothetical protein
MVPISWKIYYKIKFIKIVSNSGYFMIRLEQFVPWPTGAAAVAAGRPVQAQQLRKTALPLEETAVQLLIAVAAKLPDWCPVHRLARHRLEPSPEASVAIGEATRGPS